MMRAGLGTAIVVGGGIGGLTSALELQRRGVKVTVYERREELGEVNTGFLLWSFAIKRLRALGLGDGVDEIGEPVRRVITWSSRGRKLNELPLDTLNEQVGAPSYDVHRAGLVRLLADAVGAGNIRLGEACVGIAADGERAAALLEGGEAVDADLLVGADGVNSTVRGHVAGPVELKREDIAVWRGVAALSSDDLPPGHHVRILGPRAVFGGGHVDERRVRWYAAAPMPAEQNPTLAERRQQVEERFGKWPDPVPAIIAATDAGAFLFNDAPRARPLRRWSRGSAVLLGDAAHPTLPTLAVGGGMAIEDAAVLGECLDAASDLHAALDQYSRRRRRLAARIQLESSLFGQVLGIGNPLLRAVRDLGFRLGTFERKGAERLMRGGRSRRADV